MAPQQEMKRFLPPGPIRSESKIYGLGEMAELTRTYNWGNSAVGPIETWPEVLLTTVNTMLNSRHPMFLWWGDDLIQFYNDAYRPTIGGDKHPRPWAKKGTSAGQKSGPSSFPRSTRS